MKKALLIIAGLFVVLVIVSIAAGGGEDDDSGSTATSPKSEPTETDEVTITSCAVEEFVEFVVVKGEATNGSSKRSDYSIDVAIEGPDGVQLGTTIAFAQNVEPGQTALWESPTATSPVEGFTCRIVDVERDASL